MRSEDFFFRDRGQYTIFLYSRPERANFRLEPRPESWHFLAAVQKNVFSHNFCEKYHFCKDHEGGKIYFRPGYEEKLFS